MSETIPVYVGCSANHEDAEAQAVLEYSLRKHASRPVDITWMRLSRDWMSPFRGRAWPVAEDNWATPFSGFRWVVSQMLPAASGSRAIYVDVDFVFLEDAAELLRESMDGADYLADQCTGIMLWDCEQAAARVGTYRGGPLPPGWNCRDRIPPGAKAVHFTNLHTQPHMPLACRRLEAAGARHWNQRPQRPHPSEDVERLFTETLNEAVESGYPVEKYTDESVFPKYGAYGSPARLGS